MKKLAFAAVLLAATLFASTGRASGGRGLAGSKHDLSASGPGPIRALSEQNPCVFCHIAHDGGQTLSSRPDPTAKHRPYESDTLSTRPGTPTGASRLCLSCHDGTIAPGQTRKGKIAMSGAGGPIGKGRRAHLGTDLRGSHPVSFRPASGKGSVAPRPGDSVRLDRRGEMQCTSCHDPHSEWIDPDVGKFLVKRSEGSALCLSCHTAAGSGGLSSHATSSASFTMGDGRTVTVAQAGCSACHASHGAETRGRLLRPGRATDDAECLDCHSGAIARHDVGADLKKPWAHASKGRGEHDATEGKGRGPRRLPEPSAGARRHVACADCHDPHSATSEPGIAPTAGGALAGVWGIALDGEPVAQARFEYEVCFKCHGDSANKPQAAGISRVDAVRRADDDTNLRRVFDPSSPSYHPVAAPGRNPFVPSLRAPLNPSSVIYCSDCHASNTGPGAGGSGARGPHGSIYPYLLERQYLTADFTPESPSAYALCYKCHDRDLLLSDVSPFPHRRHVVDSSAPCSACHDAHGISSAAGTARENAHLVSFDLAIVRARPGGGGRPRYQALGVSGGSCNLSCHGTSHDGVASGRY